MGGAAGGWVACQWVCNFGAPNFMPHSMGHKYTWTGSEPGAKVEINNYYMLVCWKIENDRRS